VEDLVGDVGFDVHATHEGTYLPPQQPLDHLAKLGLGRVLKEEPHVTQPLVLAEFDQLFLDRRQAVLERADSQKRRFETRRAELRSRRRDAKARLRGYLNAQ
jgi:hypothetical protein